MLWHGQAQAATHRAALLVSHGSSWPGAHLIWRCVEFAQESISGLALLELAGVNSGQPPQVYDWGGGALTVCQIDREPRQIPDRCFGPTSGPNWSDWQRTPAGWAPRPTGVTGYMVRDGDLEAWTYSSSFGTPPPSVSFGQVCSTPAAPAAPAAQSARAVLAPSTPRGPVAVSAPHPTPTPAPTPLEALAPSASASTRTAVAGDAPLRQPAPARPPWPILVFGATLVLLAGLGGWNALARRQ